MAVLQPEFADPRRDRLGPRHRRPADRRRGCQRPAEPRPGGAAHHPLPAPARLHQAGRGPRPGPRPDHQDRRQRAGPRAGAGRLRARSCGPPATRSPPRTPSPSRRSRTRRRPNAMSASPLDSAAIRADFPLLRRDFGGGRSLAYLDSAATALKPQPVLDALEAYNTRYTANIHRGIYTTAEEATAAYEAARATAARFLNAPSASEIVFVRNATEAINLVAYSWGRRNIRRADTIVLTELEHHSNLVPWQLLVQEQDADLEFVAIDEQGRLDQQSFEVLLRTRPKLVAFNHVSNALGTINPVREMTGEGPRGGRPGAHRRRPGRAPRPGRRAGHRCRLLRLLRPQGARADRLGRALGAPRAAGGDAAVHGWWRDDPRGPPPAHDVQRRALEVRGGHARHRGRDRPGCRAGVPRRRWAWTGCARTSGRSPRTPSTCCPARCPASGCIGPAVPGRARRHRDLHPAGHPRPRRGDAARPRGDRHPCRPPLHPAAPRAPGRVGHRPRQLQRLHHDR